MMKFFPLFLLLVLVPFADAFPPAPGFTICGIARDQFGWALRSSDDATLVVKQGEDIVAEASIDERLIVGENFRVLVPIDTDPSDAYTPTAQSPGSLISLEVQFPGGAVPIASLTVEQRTIGQPGGKLVVDFTLGEDLDGDMIPDSWEFWQLDEAGIAFNDPLYSLATFSKNGDFDKDGTSDFVEYLAGTFAFLASETLNLEIVEVTSDGWIRLSAFVVVAKAYQIEGASNFNDWAPVDIGLDGDRDNLVSAFIADDTEVIDMETPKTEGAASRAFRLRLR
ncbi:MAG: hypothetical protein AAGA58_17505 [Verrucomicrobiota bacterium]